MEHKIISNLDEVKLKFKDAVETNKTNFNKHWKLSDLVSNKELYELAQQKRWDDLTIAVNNYQLTKKLQPSGILTRETLDNLK